MASAVPIGRTSIAAMPADRLLKLAATATAAGIFSGLFGVGGGTVIVPLLIFLFAYGERAATGTSLLAIAVIGLFAALGQALYGNVDLAEGLLVGIPAVAGVIVGAAVQQRVPERVISLLFAALLTVVAIQFLIG
jgi:uncharacterized membrane protein YfcA